MSYIQYKEWSLHFFVKCLFPGVQGTNPQQTVKRRYTAYKFYLYNFIPCALDASQSKVCYLFRSYSENSCNCGLGKYLTEKCYHILTLCVIQVGAAVAGGTSGETQTSLGSARVDQTQQVTVGQRPEIKRLTVEKVPLRESRSLDDTRAKGLALTLSGLYFGWRNQMQFFSNVNHYLVFRFIVLHMSDKECQSYDQILYSGMRN